MDLKNFVLWGKGKYKRPQSVWFHVYEILEEAKLW